MKNSKNFLPRSKTGLLILGPLLMTSPALIAGGFKLPVQNVTNMGLAYAGTASLAIDASTNYYNSAGLVRLCEEQVIFGAAYNLAGTKVNVSRATTTIGTPLSPSSGQAIPTNSALVPLFHYAKRINDDWVFGFSSITAFGTRTNYLDNSIVRYMNTRSSLKTVDLGPSLAYDFHNGLSIGAGVNALYANAQLNARVGTGNLDTDGIFNTTADRWGFGYHAGILYQFTPCTRVGLNYQSRIDVQLKGRVQVQQAVTLPIATQNLKSKLKLPDYATLSLHHAFDDRWAIMADVQYIGWSTYKTLQLRFQDGSTITSYPNYKNSYFAAIGGTYQYNDCWQFKLGTAYDKTPTRDGSRPLYNPDQSQTYAAIGTQYRFTKCLALELGYVHVFYNKKANINLSAPVSVGTLQGFQSVQGTVRNKIDVMGLQFTWDLM